MRPGHRTARTTSVLAGLIALLGPLDLAAPASAAAAQAVRVDVVAHGGAAAAAPQNTVAAVRLALQHGADVIETDFQRTADGVLVVLHGNLAATTDAAQVFPDRAPWVVSDFTLAEVKRLDAGSWFGPAYAGERVPTLREWAVAVGGRAGMLVEAKNPELFPGIAADLEHELGSRRVFRSALREGRLVIMSFNHDWLRAFDRSAGNVPVGLVFGHHPTLRELRSAAGWAEHVVPALTVLDALTVDKAHAFGLEVHVWTIDVGRDMRLAIRWGVDGVITDRPRLLVDVLRRR